MTVWRPADREIDAVHEAVAHAIRATIIPAAPVQSPPASADGIREVRLDDGRLVRMELFAQETKQEHRGPRLVLVYSVRGSVVVDRNGYAVSGQAVLDVVARAFLDVDCRLEAVGAVRP
jgi:hypothetical protein